MEVDVVRLVPFALALSCGAATSHGATGGPPKGLAAADVVDVAPPQDAAPGQGADGSLHALALTSLDGTPFDTSALRGKAVLVVNVASKCGFTRQYDGLQALYERFADRGLEIVGVPCNQFGGQEPGSAEEIASFCRMNYGVSFPLLEKQDVNGPRRSPLYRFMVDSEVGGGKAIKWNFEKFLVSPDGAVVARWPSSIEPDDPGLLAAIESVLPPTP